MIVKAISRFIEWLGMIFGSYGGHIIRKLIISKVVISLNGRVAGTAWVTKPAG
jgi:hypothetical protein